MMIARGWGGATRRGGRRWDKVGYEHGDFAEVEMQVNTISTANGSQSRPKGKGGRPYKLTPQVQRRVLRLARRGLFRKDLAAVAGMGLSTFYRALADPRNREFREHLDRVETLARARISIKLHRFAASLANPDFTLRYAKARWPSRFSGGRSGYCGPRGPQDDVAIEAEEPALGAAERESIRRAILDDRAKLQDTFRRRYEALGIIPKQNGN